MKHASVCILPWNPHDYWMNRKRKRARRKLKLEIADQVRLIRPVLERAAARRETMTYTEVGDACGLNRRSLGPALTVISEITYREKGVLLSAVVVLKETGQPSEHFFEVARRFKLDTRDKEKFHDEELMRVFKAYSKKRS